MADIQLDPLVRLLEVDGLPSAGIPDELARLYDGDLGLDERTLYANFVVTLDGVVAIPPLPDSNTLVAGDSEIDRFVMGLLRAFADVVLIGAGVLRASPTSTWLPAKIYPAAADGYAALRTSLGIAPQPEVAVVTGSGSIDPAHPRLEAGAVVLTSEVGASRLAGRLPEATTTISVGAGPALDPDAIVAALRERGHGRILCEAGPHTFGKLLAAGLVDEVFATVSPLLLGDGGPGSRLRLVEATDFAPHGQALRLLGTRCHGSHLFHRFAVEAA